MCIQCPFTCKNAEICKPKQLLDEMRHYLPSVVDELAPTTLTKPSISCSIEMDGHTYYF